MSDDTAPMPEPITSEEFDMLSLRLESIRAMLGVGTFDEMEKNSSPYAFTYVAVANWIRATQLAAEIARTLSGPLPAGVSVVKVHAPAIHQHVELIRAALSRAEELIAEWPKGER